MKKILSLIFLTYFFSTAYSQDNTLSSVEKYNGWELLFNGQNLDGFKQLGGNALYKVQEGSIVGTTVKGTPNSFLTTEKMYGDFILELELFVDPKMNSGIQFRSNSDPNYNNGKVHGYQMEIDPSARAWSGGIYDEGRRDWLYIPEINPDSKAAFKNGQWNKYRIEAIGNVIRTYVNGVPISYLVDNMTATGFFGLQVHSVYGDMKEGMEIRWKNIKINTKNLQSTPINNCPVINLIDGNLSEQEIAQGFISLFDGSNFNAFRGINMDKMPGRWTIENKEIKIIGTDGSETGNDIVTKEKYGAFELVFDFKLSEGANSGVKYYVDESIDAKSKSGIGLEYQILDDEKHPDAKQGVVGNRTLASLYDLIPSYKLDKRFQRKIGDWNQGRIIAYPNNKVEHWLNGFKVVEYTRGTPVYNALVARSKYANYPNFGMAKEGNILFQDHGNTVFYKNIKIRKL